MRTPWLFCVVEDNNSVTIIPLMGACRVFADFKESSAAKLSADKNRSVCARLPFVGNVEPTVFLAKI